MTSMTTSLATVSGIRDAAPGRTRRTLTATAGDVLAAAVAVLAVAVAGGSLPGYGWAALIVGWAIAQACASRATAVDGPQEARIGVLRGTVATALGCWLAGTVLPVAPLTLAGFVAAAAVTSLLVRPALAADGVGVRTIVVGSAEEAGTTAAVLSHASGGRLVAVAACRPEDLAGMLDGTAADLVLALPGPELCGRALQRLGWQLEEAGVPLVLSTRLADVATARTRVARVGALDLLHLAPAVRRGAAPRLKALWERAAAGTLILLIAPVLIGVALAVRLDSPGPVVFRQRRIGLDGTAFTMLKFRTMYVDAPERLAELRNQCDELLFKLREDPRVTRVGRVLRRFSLDELPQLINVLRGEMALVGPRPALPEEVAAYDEDPRHRLVVKPGLTGLWQVSGRSDLSWDETVRLDLDYVDNWSIGRDLSILARTFGAVLGHRGAY